MTASLSILEKFVYLPRLSSSNSDDPAAVVVASVKPSVRSAKGKRRKGNGYMQMRECYRRK